MNIVWQKANISGLTSAMTDHHLLLAQILRQQDV
jgi:hypothetical protein